MTYSTAEVATFAGVHKDTILRWLRSGLIQEPLRDRRGWRVFSQSELREIVDFARDPDVDVGTSKVHEESVPYSRLGALERIDWNFEGAKTNYLTHGIHPYPAKFIPQIPNALIQELSAVGDTVGDIFCGSGTTLVEAQLLKRNAVGVDANPLAVLLSRAKLARLTGTDIEDLRELCEWSSNLSVAFSEPTTDLFQFQLNERGSEVPADAKLNFWFETHVISELGAILYRIRKIDTEQARTVASAAFSSIVVAVSRQDSDTRYVRREKNIAPGETSARFSRALRKTANTLVEYLDATEERFSARTIEANVLSGPDIGRLDLMVCSPPYPNAYSYHLYHRSRMIWLGMDQPKFKSEEIGSHRKYSSKGKNGADIGTFRVEMETILGWLRDHLSDRAYACFVVGDSTIRGKRFDNATMISDLAQGLGYREKGCLSRKLQSTKKSFNPSIGKIKEERILILQKA